VAENDELRTAYRTLTGKHFRKSPPRWSRRRGSTSEISREVGCEDVD